MTNPVNSNQTITVYKQKSNDYEKLTEQLHRLYGKGGVEIK